MDNNRADIGIWHLDQNMPKRYSFAKLRYEKLLEDWIESDPTLISTDMAIVGRQVGLDSGKLDLLGINTFGQWAVIELKREKVRRDTVAQALDYAGCLTDMTINELKQLVEKHLKKRGLTLSQFLKTMNLDDSIFDDPDIHIYIVGTGRDANLHRITQNVKFNDSPINVVTFDVFSSQNEEHILVRQLNESEITSNSISHSSKSDSSNDIQLDRDAKIQRLFDIAQENGIGEEFQKIHNVAISFGLYPKLYKWSIMYAPQSNRNRVLVCSWVKPKNGLFDIYINTDAFEEFFPISKRKARQIAGESLRYHMTTNEVDEAVKVLNELFTTIKSKM